MKYRTNRNALLAAAFVAVVAASPSFAMGDWPPEPPHPPGGGAVTRVPEIDAGSGLASLAVIFSALALAWERRQKA